MDNEGYATIRARELRAMSDEVLVDFENAALSVHASLNEDGFATPEEEAALTAALKALGSCDCEEAP